MTVDERHQTVTPGEGQKSVPVQWPTQQVACSRAMGRVQCRSRQANEKTKFWCVVQEWEPK